MCIVGGGVHARAIAILKDQLAKRPFLNMPELS